MLFTFLGPHPGHNVDENGHVHGKACQGSFFNDPLLLIQPETSYMPQLPVISGLIDRRILVNYRIDPSCAAKALPAPFRPRLHNGFAVGGVCLIRFQGLRPRGLPEAFGLSSENAAYRIAVEWDEAGATRVGVFIPRRDTDSRLNALAGGRLFPGQFQHAHFRVSEGDGRYSVEVGHGGRAPHILFNGQDCDAYPATSIFGSLEEAAAFVAEGAMGYSPHRRDGFHEGMELRLLDWHMSPLNIETAYVQLFEDSTGFPSGSCEIDSATVMKQLKHEWHGMPSLGCDQIKKRRATHCCEWRARNRFIVG